MSAPSKQAVLQVLDVKRLGGLCDTFALDRSRVTSKDELAGLLHRSKTVSLEALLGHLGRDELKAACLALKLDESGVAKQPLVDRILGRAPSQVTVPVEDSPRPAPANTEPQRAQPVRPPPMEALDAHTLMSTQALNSTTVQHGIKDILLNHAGLWEALR